MTATTQGLPLCGRGHVQAQAGGQFCMECGAPLLAAPGPGEPACAIHPNVRAAQPCTRCGNFACQACLRAGLEGRAICVACEARGVAVDLPWDRRAEVGTIRAFIKTSWEIVIHPVTTLERARPDGTVLSSLWFAILAEVATYLTTVLIYGATVLAVIAAFALGERGDRPSTASPLFMAGIGAAFVAAMAVALVISAVLFTLLSTALDHLVLTLVGANPLSFERTLRAHALSMAAGLAGVIPFCGPYAVVVWALVLRVFAYRGLHRASTGQAIAGALLVPGVLTALGGAAWLATIILAGTIPTP